MKQPPTVQSLSEEDFPMRISMDVQKLVFKTFRIPRKYRSRPVKGDEPNVRKKMVGDGNNLVFAKLFDGF